MPPRKSTRKSRAKRSLRKSTKKVLKRSPPKKAVRKSVRRSRSPSSSKCRSMVYKKIAINLKEMKQGVYVSPQQAIAVAYAQVREKNPSCKRILTKKK